MDKEKIRGYVDHAKRDYARKVMRLGREKLRECDQYERMAKTPEQRQAVQRRRAEIQRKMAEVEDML